MNTLKVFQIDEKLGWNLRKYGTCSARKTSNVLD